VIEASGIAEDARADEAPADYVARVAREKAAAVSGRRPQAWILAADTIVVHDGTVLGKPADAEEARGMLRRLSGRVHEVVTAYALLAPGGAVQAERCIRSTVHFRRLTEEEIEIYVRSGEPYGKAGAYAIQGGAGVFVRELRGSYSNVVGLPVDEVLESLRAAGLVPAGGDP